MDPETVARRWADTWSRAWPQRDAEAIAALYADTVVHRSTAFRPPGLGLGGIRRYLDENFAVAMQSTPVSAMARLPICMRWSMTPRAMTAAGPSRARNSRTRE